jgi:hypothetical protein
MGYTSIRLSSLLCAILVSTAGMNAADDATPVAPPTPQATSDGGSPTPRHAPSPDGHPAPAALGESSRQNPGQHPTDQNTSPHDHADDHQDQGHDHPRDQGASASAAAPAQPLWENPPTPDNPGPKPLWDHSSDRH